MELIPILVECHSGYKANEYPTKFMWNNLEFEIVEIIDRWYEAYNKSPAKPIYYFKVKTNLAGSYMLRYESGEERWFLVV